jgi:hypothetical protein
MRIIGYENYWLGLQLGQSHTRLGYKLELGRINLQEITIYYCLKFIFECRNEFNIIRKP